MTRVGVTVDDIGDQFSWCHLRDFVAHLPPVPECALFRAHNPASWWWTPEFDFFAALLNAAQWANWQRGGGKGDKPQPVRRPRERSKSKLSAEQVAQRRVALKRRKAGG
jgi:hypothetical protein